ncbi:MAG: HDIG domain-containing protein [Candidatus Rokubacteria bacterium]|nr:HDIG domain-containing protein [Candidatus Rokubacteria bacterium]
MASLGLGRLGRAQVALLRTLARAAGPRRRAALVGGVVRDCRLGRPAPADLDVAVASGALELARRVAARAGAAFVPLDPERGTARVVAGPVRLDVSDFRAATLEGDLAARDYTVNALAVPLGPLLRTGRARIVDPTGGLADIAARRLRLPDPRVLADDPLRALRGVRLEAALGLRLTPPTAAAIRATAPALAAVSAERVRDELLLLLALPTAARALRRADALGLLGVILPEVAAMRGCAQPAPHRFDVREHSLRAVAGADRLLPRLAALRPLGAEIAAHLDEELGGGVTRGTIVKLAALLHDVAKPETRREVGGRIRFFEHDAIGAARARAIGERWRLPARAVAVLERLVRQHLRPMHLEAAGRVTRRARWRFYRDLGADARDLLVLALVDAAAVTGASPLLTWRRAALVRGLLAGVAEEETAAATPPLVRGEDVMARFGLPPGPAVGRLLQRAREAQALGLVRTREEALAYLDSPRSEP